MITIAIAANSNISFLSEDNHMSPQLKIRTMEQKGEYGNSPSVSSAFLWEMIKLKVRELN